MHHLAVTMKQQMIEHCIMRSCQKGTTGGQAGKLTMLCEGSRLHVCPTLVKASEGVVGGGCKGGGGVQGSQHLLGCSPRLPGGVGGYKTQEGLLHLSLPTA